MDYKVTALSSFKVIGFQKTFGYQEAYREIPKSLDDINQKYSKNIYDGNKPANDYEKAIEDHHIGEYGICIDDNGDGKFRYLIAGKYTGGDIPAESQHPYLPGMVQKPGP